MAKLYKTVERPLEDIIPYPDNAKVHTQEQVALLAGRILKEGFNQPIVVDKDLVIIKGHGRRLAAIKLKLDNVPVVILKDLSPAEVKAARLADNKIAEKAEYDLDKIKLELADIVAEINLESIGFDSPSLSDLGLGSLGGEEEKAEEYTRTIKTPVYEMTGKKPELNEMYDTSKRSQLIGKIDNFDLPDDEKKFLRHAAYRHNVFRYDKIAEYYAHASKEVQELMEDSALVIVDFNKAIEGGYIQLSEALMEGYKDNDG